MGGGRGLAQLFNIRPGEARLAGLSFLQSAFIGLPRLFTMTLGNALFLSTYSAAYLPLIYLGSALLNPILGSLYLFLEKRVSFRALQNLMNLILALASTSFAALLFGGFPPGLAGAGLLVWLDIEWTLTNLVYWGTLNRIYTVEQSKRLYGLVGSGEILVMVLGGLLAGLVIAEIGIEFLIFFSLGGFILSFLGINLLFKRLPTGEAYSRPGGPPIRSGRSAFVVLLILFFGISQYGLYFFGDTVFYMEAGAQYPDADGLGQFLSRYFAILGLLTLGFKLFFSGRLLPKLGLGRSLALTPIGMGIGGFAVSLGVLSGAGLAFPAAVGLRLFQAVFFSGLLYPAFYSLLQPLEPRIRSRVQTQSELIFGPMTGILFGAVLFLLTGPAGFASLELGLILAAASLAWVLLAQRVFREYRRALDRAVDAGDFSSGALELDEAALAQLAQGLETDTPVLAELKLNVLEAADYAGFGTIIDKLSRHGNSAVRRSAYRRVREIWSERPAADLVRRIRGESDSRAALELAASLAPMLPPNSRFPDSPEIAGLLQTAVAYSLAPSSDRLGSDLHDSVLRGHLESLRLPQVLEAAIDLALAQRSDAEHLVRAYGALAFDTMRRRLAGADLSKIAAAETLVRLFARTCGPSAVLPILEAGLAGGGRLLRTCLNLGFRICGPAQSRELGARSESIRRIVSVLESDLRGILRLERDFAAESPTLAQALNEEFDSCIAALFHLLAILHPGAPVESLSMAFVGGRPDRQALVLERLEMLLEPEYRALVLPLLMPGAIQPGPAGSDPGIGEWTAALLSGLDQRLRHAGAGWEDLEASDSLLRRGKITQELATLGFFRDFRAEQRWQTAASVRVRKVPAGTEVIRQGDTDRSVYIAADGTPRVEKDGKVLTRLAPGSVIGEFAALDDAPRSATVVEEAGGTWLELSSEDLQLQVQEHPETGTEILRAILQKTDALGARGVLDGAVDLGVESVADFRPGILERAGLLRTLPLFQGLGADELLWFAGHARPVEFALGEPLWPQGFGLGAVLVFWAGELVWSDGTTQHVPRDISVLGQSAVLGRTEEEDPARAGVGLRGIRIERRVLEAGLLRNPSLVSLFAAPFLAWLRRR